MKKALAAVLLSFIILVGCGGGGNSGAEGSSSSVTVLSSIVGVYDWSDFYQDGTIDEWYLAIAPDGWISDYDYRGDSYDRGRNCYVIDRNWERLAHLGDNRFVFLNGDIIKADFFSGSLVFTPVSTESGVAPPLVAVGPRVEINVSSFEAAEC